ncbi:Uncharacterized protein TPAR_07094 [Tolypocladium paradoxum]|uniref:Uncharacterized protein n=1 Tax=Tolypocladium paradoxum TaxID=94208 RepID=A0A2S4KR67_9HYPO|nr:Uncharacterized protein TPAR_07094 [Tolypocladium paradoxum]
MDADEIRTPRLLLKQLQTNDAETQDLDYHGPCKSREESQHWTAGALPRNATGFKIKISFIVLCKTPGDPTAPHGGEDGWKSGWNYNPPIDELQAAERGANCVWLERREHRC